MPEWWTYRLSDFLMFTPSTYYRLIERHNAALWPLQLITLSLGLVLVHQAWRGGARPFIAPGVLAGLWLLVAWAFHWRHYASINLAAKWFAVAFVLEALLLAGWAGVEAARPLSRGTGDKVGLAVALFGLVLQPSIGPLLGRKWAGVELFGMAPDPTATVTLGLLLLMGTPASLLVIPLLWCVMSWATLWAMESGEAWVMLTAGVVVVVELAVRRVKSEKETGNGERGTGNALRR